MAHSYESSALPTHIAGRACGAGVLSPLTHIIQKTHNHISPPTGRLRNTSSTWGGVHISRTQQLEGSLLQKKLEELTNFCAGHFFLPSNNTF